MPLAAVAVTAVLVLIHSWGIWGRRVPAPVSNRKEAIDVRRPKGISQTARHTRRSGRHAGNGKRDRTAGASRPIRPRILRREVTKGSAVEGSYLEVELVGANNAKQVFTSLSSKAGEVTTLHMTVASHADASDPTPTETSESTMVVHRKPIDANHSEVSGTLVMDGKVSKIGPVTAVRPSNLPSTEDMTDDELIANFLTPRLEGRKP